MGLMGKGGQLSPNGGSAFGGGGGVASAVLGTLLYELCEDRVFAATTLVGAVAYDEYVLTGEEFASMGPAIVDVVVHAEGLSFSSNFTYDVVLQYKYKYGAWTSVPLLTLQSSGTYAISSPYTTRSSFGMQCRIVLRTQVSAGSSATQHGTLSVSAAVRLYSAS